jgi:hypothetical protein
MYKRVHGEASKALLLNSKYLDLIFAAVESTPTIVVVAVRRVQKNGQTQWEFRTDGIPYLTSRERRFLTLTLRKQSGRWREEIDTTSRETVSMVRGS